MCWAYLVGEKAVMRDAQREISARIAANVKQALLQKPLSTLKKPLKEVSEFPEVEGAVSMYSLN